MFCVWFTAVCCAAAAGLVLPRAVSAGGDREEESAAGERRGGEDGNAAPDLFPHTAEIRYADGFTVEYHGNYKYVRILEPWQGSDENFEYILVQRGTAPPEGYPDAQVIEIPVETIVTMSTTYVTYLDMLGELDALVGIDSFLFVMNPGVREMIEEGDPRRSGKRS